MSSVIKYATQNWKGIIAKVTLCTNSVILHGPTVTFICREETREMGMARQPRTAKRAIHNTFPFPERRVGKISAATNWCNRFLGSKNLQKGSSEPQLQIQSGVGLASLDHVKHQHFARYDLTRCPRPHRLTMSCSSSIKFDMKDFACKAAGTAHQGAILINNFSNDASKSRTSSKKNFKLHQGR